MIAEIIARLQAQVPSLKRVAGAAEFQTVTGANVIAPPAWPVAYVLRMSEQGGEPLTYSRMDQRVSTEIGIILALQNVADATGAARRSGRFVSRYGVCVDWRVLGMASRAMGLDPGTLGNAAPLSCRVGVRILGTPRP